MTTAAPASDARVASDTRLYSVLERDIINEIHMSVYYRQVRPSPEQVADNIGVPLDVVTPHLAVLRFQEVVAWEDDDPQTLLDIRPESWF